MSQDNRKVKVRAIVNGKSQAQRELAVAEVERLINRLMRKPLRHKSVALVADLPGNITAVLWRRSS